MTAHDEIKNICKFINEIQADCGKEKRDCEVKEIDQELNKSVREFVEERLVGMIRNPDGVCKTR